MATSFVQIVVYLSLVVQVFQPQTCPGAGTGNGLPIFQDYRGDGIERNRITRHHQAIISSYIFDCDEMCGNITEWGVDVHTGGSGDNMRYTLDLQVWRPSATVDDSTGTGCYSLVGNNRFTSITLSGGVAQVTPSPQDYIQFRLRDVLGFYVEEGRDSDDGVVILTSYNGITSFTSELVWYASITPTMAISQNGDCSYSVGSSGVLNTLTQAAPVISISTVTYSCPPLTSMARPTPSPISGEEIPTRTMLSDQSGIPSKTSEGGPSTISDKTDNLVLSITPLIVGVVIAIVIAVIALTLLTIGTIVVTVKNCRLVIVGTTVPTTNNQAYGLAIQNGGVEESMYSYPDVNTAIETKKNGAYAANTDIITEGNQAYAMNITTENNAAYKPVTTVETVDEYDYI